MCSWSRFTVLELDSISIPSYYNVGMQSSLGWYGKLCSWLNNNMINSRIVVYQLWGHVAFDFNFYWFFIFFVLFFLRYASKVWNLWSSEKLLRWLGVFQLVGTELPSDYSTQKLLSIIYEGMWLWILILWFFVFLYFLILCFCDTILRYWILWSMKTAKMARCSSVDWQPACLGTA